MERSPEQREQHPREEAGREHQRERELEVAAERDHRLAGCGHGRKRCPVARGDRDAGEERGKRRPLVGTRMPTEPGRGGDPAGRDPQQDHGQHHGERPRARGSERQQQPEPDHLQCQQDSAREEGACQETPRFGAERRASGRLASLDSASGPGREGEGACRRGEVQRGRHQSRAANADRLDQDQVAGQSTQDGAEGVPAVEAPERAAEVGIVSPKRGGDERQRGSHRARGDEQESEGDGDAQHAERRSSERPHERSERVADQRKQQHQRDTGRTDHGLERGVDAQRGHGTKAPAGDHRVPERQARHERGGDQSGCPDRVPEGETGLAKPERLEDEGGRAGQEEHEAQRRSHPAGFYRASRRASPGRGSTTKRFESARIASVH